LPLHSPLQSMIEARRKTVRALIPMLVCRDGASEVDFCKAAFDAIELSRRVGDDQSVVHATLSIEGALIMIHGEFSTLVSRSPELDGSSCVVVYLYVEDVDLTLEKAVRAGAKILIPVASMPWGDRTARILDPAGHVWNISTRVEE
jgi:PhnB protein